MTVDTEISELEIMTEKGEVVDFDFSPYEHSDDPNKKTHIIRGKENDHLWQEGMDAQDVVDLARLGGHELTALCGFKWVPKLDPAKHELCDECVRIWEMLG